MSLSIYIVVCACVFFAWIAVAGSTIIKALIIYIYIFVQSFIYYWLLIVWLLRAERGPLQPPFFAAPPTRHAAHSSSSHAALHARALTYMRNIYVLVVHIYISWIVIPYIFVGFWFTIILIKIYFYYIVYSLRQESQRIWIWPCALHRDFRVWAHSVRARRPPFPVESNHNHVFIILYTTPRAHTHDWYVCLCAWVDCVEGA